MAWSSAILSAADTANQAADKPLVMASHGLRDEIPSIERWVRLQNIAGADRTETGPPGHPVKYSRDGHAHAGLHTRPNLNDDPMFLMFQWTTGIDFDCLIIHPSSINEVATINVGIADDGNHSVNNETIAALTVADGYSRIVELDLHHTGSVPLAYTGVTNLSFEFVGAVGGSFPNIREIWMGKRVQLNALPREPFQFWEQSQAPVVRSRNNRATSYAVGEQGSGRRRVVLGLETPTELAQARRIWDESLQGTEPFYWIENPGSNPAAYLMRFDQENTYNPALQDAPTRRSWGFDMIEQAPYLQSEV